MASLEVPVECLNPLAVNDLWFAGQTGVPLDRMNLHGCSLVYRHSQGPTGARLIVELPLTLRHRGGVGLFTGCAAGDTGAAPPWSSASRTDGRSPRQGRRRRAAVNDLWPDPTEPAG